MKNKLLIAVLFLLLHYSGQSQSTTVQPFPAHAEAFYDKAMPQVRTEIKSWVIKTAVQWKSKPADEALLRNTAINQFPDIKSIDIDALIVLVMTKCANDEESELREQIEEMKKNKDPKAGQKQAASVSSLQERRGKFIASSNNLMKKISPAQENIIRDLK